MPRSRISGDTPLTPDPADPNAVAPAVANLETIVLERDKAERFADLRDEPSAR